MRRLAPYVLPPAACVALALVLTALTPAPPRAPFSPTAGGGGRGAPPDFVDYRSFGRLPLPVPARSVLEWWHANQLKDARGAFTLLSTSVRTHTGAARYALTLQRATLGFVGKPYVTRTSVHGNRARVDVVVVAFDPESPGLAYPLSFPVVREGNRWRLASIDYLELNARDKAAGRKAGKRRSARK